MSELRDAIVAEAKNLGISPQDLATVISYETAGTFNPWKKGPVTQHGQHRGLIQWGEPQRRKYGVYEGMPVPAQMQAVTQYLRDAGVRKGHGLLDIYSAVNAGKVGLYNRSDANNGGAPGTVRDKVLYQMAGHKTKGAKLLGGLLAGPVNTSSNPVENPQTNVTPPPSFQGDNGAGEAQRAAAAADQAIIGGVTDTNPYADVFAPDVPTVYEKPEEEKPYGFFRGVGAAISTEWIGSNLISRLGPEYEEDPDFEVSVEEFSAVSDKYPEIYHSMLLDAQSAGDWADRVAWVDEDVRVNSKLDDMGMLGSVIRMGAIIVDPVAIGSIIASEGLAAPIVAAAKFGRLGRIFLRGGLLGAEAGGFEAVNAQVNPKITDLDIIAAGGLGGLMGAVIGGFSSATRAEATAMRRVHQAIMDNPEGAYSVRGAGAAESPGTRSVWDDVGLVNADDVADVGKRGWRADMSAWMNKSKDSVTKLWARALLDEGVGMADHGVSTTSASIRGARRHQRTDRAWSTHFMPAMNEWAKGKGLKKGRFSRDWSDEEWYEFGGEVGDYVRDRGTDLTRHNEHAVKAGNAFRKVMKDYAEDMANPAAHRNGVADPLSEVGYDPHYFPRYADGDSIALISKKYDDRTVINFLKQAIKNVQGDIDDDLLHKIAEGYWKNIQKGAMGASENIGDAMHRGSLDDFKAAIIKANGGKSISEQDLDNLFFEASEILADTATKKVGRSDSSRTKKRTFLDENFETTLMDRTGAMGARPLRMSDFFARDADFALRKYSRHMAGRLALADTIIRDPISGKVLQHGVYSNAEIDKIIQQSADNWASMAKDLGKEAVQKGIHASKRDLGYAFSGVLGQPLYDTQAGLYRNMRRVMGVNFHQLMMSMGFNQIQETARWIGGLGLKAALTQMPSLKRIIDPVTGQSVASNRLLRELQAITGQGMDVDFRRWAGRFDDDLLSTPEYGGRGAKIDRFIQKAGQFTSQVSLMNHIHAWQQSGAMKGISQRMYDLSRHTLIEGADGTSIKHFDLSKLKGKELQKLRSLGWDDKDVTQMFRHLQKFADVEGTHLKGMNFEKWDLDASSKYGDSLFRYTRRLIQENDMGDLNHWMTQPGAKFIFQFRSFIMAAYVKNTLHGIHHFDAKTFIQTTSELVAGVSTYAAITHLRALGRSDQEEYLEKRLAWNNLVLQGYARMAAASITPAVIDAVPGVSIFQDARASGSPTDVFMGSTIANQAVGALGKGVSGAVEALVMGRKMTQGEVRALWRGIGNNHLALTPIFNAMISELPEKKPR